MSAGALDAGRRRALVVVDPHDRRKLQGVLYLTNVYCESIERAELENPRPLWVNTHWTEGTRSRQEVEAKTLQGLAELLSEETEVQARVLDGLGLDDPRLAQVPFMLLTVNAPFVATEAEARGLGRYLRSGGSVYAEVFSPPVAVAGGYEYDQPSLREFFRQAFAQVGLREGKDWRFARLGSDHPLYHCFYDIETLPRGLWDLRMWYNPYKVEGVGYLEGIWVGESLVGVYSQKAYADLWAGEAERLREIDAREHFVGLFDIGGEEVPVYRLGMNIVVYALTREGSLAEKVVAE